MRSISESTNIDPTILSSVYTAQVYVYGLGFVNFSVRVHLMAVVNIVVILAMLAQVVDFRELMMTSPQGCI